MTGIEWTDAVWNPTTGCDRVSPGCDHCYAMTMAKRLKGMGSAKYQTDGDPRTSGLGFGLAMHADTLALPLTWRKPRRVFVNSMSDLFHEKVTDAFISEVFAVMAAASQHTFQLLTKRHGRMRSLLSGEQFQGTVQGLRLDRVGLTAPWVRWPLPNVWLGVSVENQQWADIRVPALLETPAAVRWLSCEPLLGAVDLKSWLGKTVTGIGRQGQAGLEAIEVGDGIDWVVVGGESGQGARPMHPLWAEALRDQCASTGVSMFFKQWGEWSPIAPLDSRGRFKFGAGYTMADDGTLYEPGALSYPDGPRYGEAVRAEHNRHHLTAMYRVGKKTAGRLLDGELHDAFPAVAS